MRKYYVFLFVMAVVLSAGSAYAVNYCVNPSFETPAGTGTTAVPVFSWAEVPPWSHWCPDGGVTDTPTVGGVTPSPRCWWAVNGPTYTNNAAQNSMYLILDTTGTIAYHVKMWVYVPSGPVPAVYTGFGVDPNCTPRAMISMNCDPPAGTTYVGGGLRVLDRDLPSSTVTPDTWQLFEFDWFNTSGAKYMNYMSFAMFGLDSANGLFDLNPGVFIDECEFSSTQYRNDLSGVVKDSVTGNGIVGATVTLSSAYHPVIETTTTGLGGAYTFTTRLPEGNTFTVDATKINYNSDGPQSFSVSSDPAPDVTMTKALTVHINGTVKDSGGVGIVGVTVTATLLSGLSTSTTSEGPDGAYSIEVAPDSYTVTARKFPLTAPSQAAYTFDDYGQPIDVTLNFTLADATMVKFTFDGDTNDSSGLGNNGTLMGAAVVAARGRVGGGSLSTVAGNGGLSIANALGTVNAYTMCAWINVTTSQDWSELFATPGWTAGDINNILRQYPVTRQMQHGVNGTVPQDVFENNKWSVWGTNQWHFVTMVYDSTALKVSFYFDGVLDNTVTFTTAVPAVFEANSTIACWTTVDNRPFRGEIDDFRIYGDAAGAADVAAIYASYPAQVWRTITASTDGGATITPSGAVQVMDGYDQSFTMTANLGYGVTKVLVDSVEQLPIPSSYTFTNVTAAHTISVETVALPTASISGKVTDKAGIGIGGASVYFSATPSASVAPFVTAITNPDGTYIQTGVPQGTVYVSAGNVAGKWNSPDRVVVLGPSNATGIDFTLLSNTRNIPSQADLYLEMLTDSLPPSGPWPCAVPAATSLTAMGTPSLQIVGNVPWEKNKADGDGYHYINVPWNGGTPDSITGFNGGTIVVAAKPIRYTPGNSYQQLVSVLLNQFSVGVQRDTGLLRVWRGGTQYDGPTIPDGQLSIFSFVVQPTGEFKVFSNGVEVMNITTQYAFTTLTPNLWYGTDVNVGKGWNGDGWSSFNGNIGDVFIYKKALSQFDRVALEQDLGAKFGITTPVYHWITASADAGSTITPSGLVGVVDGASQTFIIAPALGYALDSVLVDGVPRTPIPTSYTFTGVVADHTISVTSHLVPTASVSGKVVDENGNGITGATVYFSGTPNASVAPISTTTTIGGGTYTQTGVPQGTIYVSASAAGKWNSPDKVIALTGNVTGVDFQLFPTTRNIPAGGDPYLQMLTENLTAGQPWPCTFPIGTSLTTIGTPGLKIVGNVPWEDNNSEADGYHYINVAWNNPPTVPSDHLTFNGGTIVVAAKPMRYQPANAYQQIVSILIDQFSIGIQRDNGQLRVWRGGTQFNGPTIPDGQSNIFSVVVQSTGQFQVFQNGALIMNVTSAYAFTILTPTAWYRTDVNVGKGWNGDSWSSFIGNIGDVFVYKTALADADRKMLEVDLSHKFGIPLDYVISGQVTSSVGGTPVNAIVTLSTNPDGSAPIKTVSTDPAGNYSVAATDKGTYYLVARKSGYTTSAPLAVAVNGADVPGQNFVLTPSGTALPFVNLNASTLTEGAWTTDWVNTGTLGGTFGNTGVNTLPTVATVAGKKAVVFTGAPALMSSVATDAGMTGPSDWSVSSWVYVPTIPASANRTYFSWASRGTNFSSSEMRYGNNYAVAHYSADTGFITIPAAAVWHNIVVTYDGNLENIYVDGFLDRSITRGVLSLKAGEKMFVGRATDPPATSIYPFAGSVASIKVFDQVLTTGEILTEAGISSVANLAALKAKAGTGETVQLTGNVTVTCKGDALFFVGEERFKGCVKVVAGARPVPAAGSFVTNLIGVVTKDAYDQYTLTLSANAGTALTGNEIKPIGMNNKAAKTDAKILTNLVRVWGNVSGATIDDGYGNPITVSGGTLGTGVVMLNGVLWKVGGNVVLYQNLP